MTWNMVMETTLSLLTSSTIMKFQKSFVHEELTLHENVSDEI